MKNSPIGTKDPTGNRAYSIDIGADYYLVLGGGAQVSFVWDDKGNKGFAITGQLGAGVKVGLAIPFVNKLPELIHKRNSNSKKIGCFWWH